MARPKGSTKRKAINKKIGESVSKFSKDVVLKLETAFSYDCTIAEACLYAGISVSAYYVNVTKKPELKERFDLLRNTPVLHARQAVVKSFNTDPNLALRYLERKRREEFSTQQIVTGEMDNKITIEFKSKSSDNKVDTTIDKDAQDISELI